MLSTDPHARRVLDLYWTVDKLALSVHRPWSWAIISLFKDVENRTWATTHRGDLLIHSSNTTAPHAAATIAEITSRPVPTDIPGGVLLGLVQLTNVHHADECGTTCSPWAEPGVYHWVLARPHRFAQPLPARGWPGLWKPFPGYRRCPATTGAVA